MWPDGRRLAIAGLRAGKLTIEIRDLATGLAVTSFPHPVLRWIILDWHPSGRLLATASDEADSRPSDTPLGRVPWRGDPHL